MRLIQINLHHCKAASAALLNKLAEDQPDFVLIQEPWVCKGKVCGLRTPLYKLYTANCVGRTRACIMAKSHLNVFLIHDFSNEDLLAVSWETSGSSLWLASFYFAHDDPGPLPSLLARELVKESETDKHGLIIGGDSNAHHTLWGSTDVNERGELLFNYILSSNLLLCNTGNEPTFITRNRQEVLDITLVSDFLFEKVVQWKVLSEHSFSDHRYIEMSLQNKVAERTAFRNRKNTNWPVYERELKRVLPFIPPYSPDSAVTLDTLIETFNNCCSKALDKACVAKIYRGKKQPPWWSAELRTLKTKCGKLCNRAKFTREETDWNSYFEQYKIYKKELRKAKRQSWRSFCNDIEDNTEASRLRKILANSKQSIGYLQRPDKSWTKSSEESLELLMNSHFPTSVADPGEDMIDNTDPESVIANIVTETSITWAVGSFKPYKSPGPDDIFPAQLQHTIGHIMEWLKNFFSCAIRINYVPSSWKKVKVVFIPKAGRSSHISPKDFRPISLSSFLLKTLERLIEAHISRNIPSHKLAISQHAYCKGKSTETALNSLVTEIEKSFEYKEFTLAAFLDIEGAFNNIQPKAIISALSDLGISGTLVNFIKQMLVSRLVNSQLGVSEVKKTISRGTPQGGVLSPLLWALSMNKLLISLEEKKIHVVAYADDIAITVRGKFPNTLSEIMQGILISVDLWSKSCGLGVNAEKTVLILFTRKHRIPAITIPTLSCRTLSLNDKVKYLGLTLDRKLSWKLNVEERARKASVALYTCKKTVGLNWGLSPKIMHWLYTAVVRPILTYGILVWWPALEKKYVVNILGRIQRAASLCISGAIKTTPTEALNIILYLLPVDLNGKQLAAKSALRLRENSLLNKSNKGHSIILDDFPVIPNTTDYCKAGEFIFSKSYNITFPTREDWDEGVVDCNNKVSIYTDGSKLNDKVGGGVYSEKLGIRASFRLPDHCSVFQAEIMAIKECLHSLKYTPLSVRDIAIYSDSQAALKSLSSLRSTSKTVLECCNLLDELILYFNISLTWVPGHSEVPGNCKADELAKLGTTQDIHVDKANTPIPLATCKLLLDRHIIDLTNTRWRQSPFYMTSRLTWPELDLSRSKLLLRLNRQDVRNLIGALTGHCLIGRHANRLGVPHHDYCRSCQEADEEETVEHLLCRCQALSRKRLSILGSAFLDSITEVVGLKITKLNTFLKATGWFKEDPQV